MCQTKNLSLRESNLKVYKPLGNVKLSFKSEVKNNMNNEVQMQNWSSLNLYGNLLTDGAPEVKNPASTVTLPLGTFNEIPSFLH